MELYSAEVAKLKSLLEDWWLHRETELEATFGVKGQVDVQTFLTVATRLRARGFVEVPQQERLNICLPDHIRFSLNGMGQIQQYCRDDTLAGKSFLAMIKDRAAGGDGNVDIEDYDLRIKSRRELPMAPDDDRVKAVLAKWPTQNKAFRLIRRWTFKGDGIKFDLSMVRTTPRTSKGDFMWVRRFKEHKLLKSVPVYEIEVELERDSFDSVEKAYISLIRGVGEVLRGIQGCPLLIRKKTIKTVLDDYQSLMGSNKFRGVAPVTLEYQNMSSTIDESVPNIRNGYNVTDKADGLRVHGFCNEAGELFLLDIGMKVYRTGLKNKACAKSLLDGEWITKDKDGNAIQQLLFFDIYKDIGNTDVSQSSFKENRHPLMTTWVKTFNNGVEKVKGAQLLVSSKIFLFANKGDTSIFVHSNRILDTDKQYFTDGLIFTPNDMFLPKQGGKFKEQLKWKPAEDNTVDFLVQFEKDTELKNQDKVVNGVHPATGKYVKYKVLRLLVGSSRDPAYDDPRSTVLYNQPLGRGESQNEYKPVLFNPKDFPDTMANVCYRELVDDATEEYVVTERNNEPINDRSIVECRYDPSQPSGWRWIPIRIRVDKTGRLLKGQLAGTLNNELAAESVWNSIHQPVTNTMIRTGAEQPTETEVIGLTEEAVKKKYYDRKAPTQDLQKVRGLRDFHNMWIKERVLYGTFFKGGSGKTLVDVAVGKAGDLQRWRRGGASFVLGIDMYGDNIRDPRDGAYRRYLDTMVRNGREKTPTCVFVIGGSQCRYMNGECGVTPEERDILRSVFGQVKPEGAIPPYIEEYAAGRLRTKADGVSCQFALHYFFENKETFDGLLQNIADSLKIGGLFFGAAFDGERVFNLLRGVQNGGKRIGTDDTSQLWTITKKYDADEIPAGDEAFGMPIDVEFISIGSSHTEYLIPFSLLVEKFKTIGLELLDSDDLEAYGLKTSSSTFDVSYDMAKSKGNAYAMSDAVKQFSFLNRWFIFKRTSEGTGVEEKIDAQTSVLDAKVDKMISNTEIPETVDEVVTVEKVGEDNGEVPGGTSVRPATAVVEAAKETVATEAIEVERTIPVLAPGAMAVKTYSPNELFQFFMDAALQDKLKIGDKGAARWLSPSAPFPIADVDEPSQIYPSVDHYIAGQRLKLASNKPDLGPAIFGREGSIHQKYIRERLELTSAGSKALPEERDYELLKSEANEVRDKSKASELRKYGAVIDDAKFVTVKNKIIRDALKQRVEKDARLRRIVDAVRSQGKVLLYYTGSTVASELGGTRRADGRIDGENKIGKFLMELAGGFDV
jgi:hypothetical protein